MARNIELELGSLRGTATELEQNHNSELKDGRTRELELVFPLTPKTKFLRMFARRLSLMLPKASRISATTQ